MKIHTDPGCATTINLVIRWPDVRRTPIFFSPKDKAKDKQETENSFMWFGGSGYILFNSHPPSASPYLPDIRIALTHTQDKNILHGRRTAMEQCGFLAVLQIHKHRECEHVNQEEIRRKSAKAKKNKVSKWGTRDNVEAKPQEKKEKQRLCENSALCNVSLGWLKQHLLQKPATDEDESSSGTAVLIERLKDKPRCAVPSAQLPQVAPWPMPGWSDHSQGPVWFTSPTLKFLIQIHGAFKCLNIYQDSFFMWGVFLTI